jgi:16S rRNA (guanine527-N7)-methyltransferase
LQYHLGVKPPRRAATLTAYADLVREWSGRLDLVSDRDLDRFEERHVADSLRLLPLLDSLGDGPAVDVGSGAGLPGIPLAIARPGRYWRLLEPRRKRAGFLEEVVRTLELENCEVVPVTAAQAAGDRHLSGAHVLAAARALAPPREAFELLRPLVGPTGVVAVFLGEGSDVPPEAEELAPGIGILRMSNI